MNHHRTHRDIVVTECYHLAHNRIRFASSVVCRTASSRPASAPNCMMHVDGVEVRIREQIQIHTQRLFPQFPRLPHFSVSGGSGSMWILRWRGDFSVATPSVLLAPCPFEGELSLNVHKRPTWNLAPVNTAARSTGRHERPGLKKHKGSTSAMRSSMLRCLDSTPAITISPDPFVSLSIQHHVGSEDTSAEPLL